MIKPQTVIILTGCIVPNTDDAIVLSDIELRKNMYIDSINWYLEHTDCSIVFCENSGFDLSENFSKNIKANRLEVLTYQSPKANFDRTKGYKEMEILEYVYEKSKFVKRGGDVLKSNRSVEAR